MKRPFLIVAGIVLVFLVGVPWGVMEWQRAKDRSDLKTELDLARAEGLATDWREFVALIRPAPAEENAGPVYRRLKRLSYGSQDISGIVSELALKRTPDALERAKAQLKSAEANLKIIDQAVSLPRCVFERDWSQGAATLFPEFADMKAAARLLALRGAVSAYGNNAADALKTANQIFKIAAQAQEEPTSIAQLVSESVTLMGLKSLAQYAWMAQSPNDKARYASALAQANDRWLKPDVLKENRGKLFEVLSIVDLCSTAEGRLLLGLKEDDIPDSEKYMKLVLSQSKARIKVVRTCRAYFAALKLPVSQRQPILDQADKDLDAALLAFPTAEKIYVALTSGGDNGWIARREDRWRARQIQYTALARALAEPKTPATISTGDLLSPFDSSPATYSFDGRQIVIQVNGLDQALKFPTDGELKAKTTP